MTRRILLISVLIFGGYVYAQQSDCKVLLPAISGSYSGECKKGLAHGKGIAQGIDRYEGQFTKGIPNGRGTYKWANGNYYEGEWQKGMRHGAGKMVYPDSTVTGIWKNDEYAGKTDLPPYKITTSLNVSRSVIRKSISTANEIKISIMQGGVPNSTIEDFSLAFDSGQEFHMGNTYGIQNTSVPLYVKVTYLTWNVLHTVQLHVVFEFTINEPGTWDVMISN
jgi:hypothetical protein